MSRRYATVPAPPPEEAIFEPNEVLLFGQRWPLTGPVRRKSVTPFPQRTAMGDYSRADRVIESEWQIGDFSGGLGIENARPNRDIDRYHVGTLETRYRFLTLAPETAAYTAVDEDASGSADVGVVLSAIDRFIAFNDAVWAIKAVGTNDIRVYKLDSVTDVWVRQDVVTGGGMSSMVGTELRDACVYDGSLYLMTSSTLYRFDGSTWSSQAVTGYALCAFDGKLFRLDGSNDLYWAVTASITTWTLGGDLQIPAGWCKQLIVFFDRTGLPAVHAITRVGVFGLDFEAQTFEPTALVHPYAHGAGKGACVWQGVLYVPVGTGVYAYSGNLVRVVGPDKDEGLPSSLQGDVKQVVAGFGFYFCVVSASATTTAAALYDPSFGPNLDGGVDDLADEFLPVSWMDPAQVNGAVLVSPSSAWHITAQHPLEGTDSISAMYDVAVLGTSAGYHLYSSDSAGVYRQVLPTGLHNPLKVPTTRYAASGYLETPWQDMGWREIDKVALSLSVEVRDCTDDEVVRLYLGWDDNETEVETWELIGTCTESGKHIFSIGQSQGRLFHTVRIRIEMERGSTVTRTPVMETMSLGYMKVPRQLDGWDLTFEITEARCEKLGTGTHELVEMLYDLRRQRRAGYFSYKDVGQEPTTRRVWLHEVIGVEHSGNRGGGRYSVLLLELDNWVQGDSDGAV